MIPFNPQYGSNQVVNATSTPAIITVNKDSSQLRIVNSGNAVAYVCAYDSTGTALVAGATMLPVHPSQSTTVTKDLRHDRVSYYSLGGTTLDIMTGVGI